MTLIVLNQLYTAFDATIDESGTITLALPARQCGLNISAVVSDTPSSIGITVSFSVDGINFVPELEFTDADFASGNAVEAIFSPLTETFVKVDLSANTDPVEVTVTLLAKPLV